MESQVWTKHIDLQHYYVQKPVADKKLNVKKIRSVDMLTESSIKILTVDNFHRH